MTPTAVFLASLLAAYMVRVERRVARKRPQSSVEEMS
jgi:hypothetical protein